MATGLRIRVLWDHTTLEDRIHLRDLTVVGAGPLAHVSTPMAEASPAPDRYVVVAVRGAVIELTVAPGAAQSIEFPGEEPVDGAALTAPLVRRMAPPFGAVRLHMQGAVIEIERWSRPEVVRDRALVAYAAAACLLALLMGGSYRLVRLFGSGERPQWGRPPSLSERDATHVRVRVGPDGLGAARAQAGMGSALRGRATGRTDVRPPKARVAKATHPRRVAGSPSLVGGGARVSARGTGDAARTQPATQRTQPPLSPEVTRQKTLEDAQSALLAADLRKAIDSFSTAAREAPLDYDQLNWLGLAHYLAGEYDQAAAEWERARGFDELRPDAINNLASVAKRRGEIDRELEYLRLALAREPHDCHASNSLALALAKANRMPEAERTLAESDQWCGGGYAYTNIQRAALRGLAGDKTAAFAELESGLKRVDTLIPVKEFEVLADLRLDPAFAPLRGDARFDDLVKKYLPRAAGLVEAGPVPAVEPPDDTTL